MATYVSEICNEISVFPEHINAREYVLFRDKKLLLDDGIPILTCRIYTAYLYWNGFHDIFF